LIEEKDRLAAFASASTREALKHQEALKATEANRATKDVQIAQLENEKACLADNNIQLDADIEKKQAVIDVTSDSINSLIYNT